MASVMTRAMARSMADSLASSSCSMSCSCRVCPCWSLKSLLRSSSPDQGVSDGPLVCSPQASSAISPSGSSRCSLGVLLPSNSASFSSGASSARSRTGSPKASAASSSASSITLVSSVSRTCACRSSEGSCSSRMACCSCGVMVSCCPMRSCRLGFNIVVFSNPSLQFEILAQVHLTDLRVGKNLIGRSGSEHRALTHDICAAADTQGLTDIMIGNEHADALVGQVLDYSLDIGNGKGAHTGKRLLPQDEPGGRPRGAADFPPPALAARKTHSEAVANMADMQLPQQLLEACGAPPVIEAGPRLQNRHDVVGHR